MTHLLSPRVLCPHKEQDNTTRSQSRQFYRKTDNYYIKKITLNPPLLIVKKGPGCLSPNIRLSEAVLGPRPGHLTSLSWDDPMDCKEVKLKDFVLKHVFNV